MQTVSPEWKKAHEQPLLGESFVEISMDITDPDARKSATSSDNGSVYISDTSEVVSVVDTPVIPYCTLEQNVWVLNGTRESIPDTDYQDGGYVGDVLSNEEGRFDKKIPTIIIDFGNVFMKLIPGITITWGTAYNEYATHFIVTAYNGDSIVAKQVVTDNNKVQTLVGLDIAEYDRITVQILEWCLPEHRARVDEIFIGLKKVYSKGNLFSYSHEQIVDPISTSLPKSEIRFSIDNSDNSYNPLNPNSMSKYLIERQSVTVRYGLKTGTNTIEWIKGGTFYLSEWDAQQNGISAEFGARDILEFMSSKYTDDTYETVVSDDGKTRIKERSLYDLAELVLGAANLPEDSKWEIDESLKNIRTSAPLPYDTIANCLQLIANAGCCVLYPDREGKIHIKPIDKVSGENTDYKVSAFNSYLKPEITLAKPIRRIYVKMYDYTIVDGEIKSESAEASLGVTVGINGELITVDNPLITKSPTHWLSVAEWMSAYLKNRMTLKTVTRADVSIDALDIISNQNEFATNKMRMTNVRFEYNGAFRGTCEGRVIEDG